MPEINSDSTSPAAPVTFDQLPLSPELLRILQEIHYQHPTPVQEGAIPPAVAGSDLMVQSQTGTGKTAAFTIPLIERLRGEDATSALVLAPTRELARQVAQEAEQLSTYVENFSVTCVYGGVSFDQQTQELKQKPTLVVGTPGRVLDHLKRRTFNLKKLKSFVLDEADEMLSMGFAEDLDKILKYIPEERQTLLFSATFPPAVKRYARKTLNDPLSLSFLSESSSADDLDHYYILIPGLAKTRHLVNLIHEVQPESALIFTNTRRAAEQVTKQLKRSGIAVSKLSGDMDQGDRDRVMKRFKAKELQLVVATDVAARGIDISQLSHVFHYDLPPQAETYIHRSGRTGRAGASGVVISLAGPQDIGVVHVLKRAHHIKLKERALPTRSTSDRSTSSSTGSRSATSKSATPRRAPSGSAAHDSSAGRSTGRSTQARDERSAQPPMKKSDAQSKRSTRRDPAESASPMNLPTAAPTAVQDVSESTVNAEQVSAETHRRELSSPKKRRPRRGRASLSQSIRAQSAPLDGSERVLDLTQAIKERSITLDELRGHLDSESPTALQDLSAQIVAHPQAERVVIGLLHLLSQSSRKRRAQTSRAPQVDASKSSNLKSRSQRSQGLPNQESPDVEPPSEGSQSEESQSEESPSEDSQQNTSWFWVNLGRRDCGGGASELNGLIAELGGLLPEDIIQMKMRAQHSLIRVPSVFGEDLMIAIHGEVYQDKQLVIEPAKSSETRSARSARDVGRSERSEKYNLKHRGPKSQRSSLK